MNRLNEAIGGPMEIYLIGHGEDDWSSEKIDWEGWCERWIGEPIPRPKDLREFNALEMFFDSWHWCGERAIAVGKNKLYWILAFKFPGEVVVVTEDSELVIESDAYSGIDELDDFGDLGERTEDGYFTVFRTEDGKHMGWRRIYL